MKLLIALFGVSGIAALISRRLDPASQSATFLRAALCIVIVMLGYFNLALDLDFSTINETTDKYSQGRMMLVALVWLTCIRAVSIVLWSSTTSSQQLPWYRYLLSELVWYIFAPVRRLPPDSPRLEMGKGPSPFLGFIARFALATAVLAVSKLFMAELTWIYLNRCVPLDEEEMRSNYPVLIQYTSIFAIQILVNNFVMDIQRFLIVLVTGGRWESIPFNNWPILSCSVGEFWSARYNALVHILLKDSVYKILVRKGISKSVATAVTFALSGFLHMHVIYTVFGERVMEGLLFFLVQLVPIIFLERLPKKDPITGKPAPKEYSLVANVLTAAFMAVTLPLYLGTMALHSKAFLSDPTPSLAQYMPFVQEVSCLGG